MRDADQVMSEMSRAIDSITALHVVTGRRPKHVPPAYWRRIADGEAGIRIAAWIISIGQIVAVFGLIGFAYCLFMRFKFWPYTGIVFPAVIILQMTLFFVTSRRLKRRFAAELVQAGGLICLDCGYNLVGSTDNEQCPECGAAIDRQEILTTWQQVFPAHFDAMFAEHGPHAVLSATDSGESQSIVTERIGLLSVIKRRPPRGIPKALWARVVNGRSTQSLIAVISAYLLAFCAGLLAIVIGAGVFAGIGKLLDWYLIEGLLALFVLIGVGLLMFVGSVNTIRTRVEAEIRESAYQRCLECGHHVTATTTCAECGADFDAEVAMVMWRAAIPELRV